jgi:hypothetical protein
MAGGAGSAGDRRGDTELIVAELDPDDGAGTSGMARGPISIVARGSGSIDGLLAGIVAGTRDVPFRHGGGSGASFAGIDRSCAARAAVAGANPWQGGGQPPCWDAGAHHGAMSMINGPSALAPDLVAGPDACDLLDYLKRVSATWQDSPEDAGRGRLTPDAEFPTLRAVATAPTWNGAAAQILAVGAQTGRESEPSGAADRAEPRQPASGAKPTWASVGTIGAMARSLCASLLRGPEGDSSPHPGPQPSGTARRASAGVTRKSLP